MTSRSLRRLAALPLAVIASMAFTACDLAMSSYREQASDTWTKTYPLSANGRVEVENQNGFIKVEPGDGATVEVHAERIARGSTQEAAKELLKSVEIGEDISSDRVRLETRRPSGGIGRGGVEVRYTLKVPASARVDLRSTNGQVEVTGITAGARLATTNGEITGRGMRGEVRASTTNGSVELEFTALDQTVHASTTNGSVTVVVPSDAKADVHAECTNGGIDVSGLQLDVEGERTRRRLVGRVNGGGPRIEVQTTNGAITVKGK